MDQPIERETVTAFKGRYSCSCGFHTSVSVYGLGQGYSSALWGLWVDRAVRRAESAAADDAESNANAVLAMTPCPNCGKRPGLLRLASPLVVLVPVLLGFGWFSYTGLSWRFASLVLTGVAVALVMVVRFWVVGAWVDARGRVAFHDRPEGTQPVRVPAPRGPHASVASTLMLGFGAVGIWLAAHDAFFLLRQKEPTSMACEAEALRSSPPDSWLQLDDCPIAYARFEVKTGDNVVVYLPLGLTEGQRPVAWLEVRGSDAEAFLADPEAAERAQQFVPLSGILGDELWGSGAAEAPIIESHEPRWNMVGMGSVFGLVLLPLAAVYWPRRRWSTIVV